MEKLVPNAKKDREKHPKEPSSDDPDLAAGQRQQRDHRLPNISEIKPLTREAYGGGMYANEGRRDPAGPRAGATQSADGPEEPAGRPKHAPPPSTDDRDLDVTGQSYIQ